MTTIQFYSNHNDFDRTKVDKYLQCKVEIAPDIFIYALAVDDAIFIANNNNKWTDYFYNYTTRQQVPVEDVEPFISVSVIGEPYTKNIEKTISNPNWSYYSKNEKRDEIVSVLDTYDDNYYYNGNNYHHRNTVTVPGPAYQYLKLIITSNDGSEFSGELKFKRPETGDVDTTNATPDKIPVKLKFFGKELTWDLDINKSSSNDYYRRASSHSKLFNIFQKFNVNDKDNLWKIYFNHINLDAAIIPTKAVKSLETNKKIAPNLNKLKLEEPILHSFYQWLHHDKVSGGISNNQCLAAFLKQNGEDYNKLKFELRSVIERTKEIKSSYDKFDIKREFCLLFDAAKQKDEEKRSHKEWYLKKTTGEQAEALGVDKEKYPLLFAAIADQNIPLGIFHNPTDKLSVVNVEFDLWEKALNRKGWGEILFQIAKNAASRSTYERDITPYISFLFKIEKYLDRHAPRSKTTWGAMPSFVNSEWQLEMDEATEEGTVKKRSALTPIADNETGIITVPYAAIAIHGRQTTYCYAKHYFVFEEFMLDDESGSVVTQDLEIALNGRDDYGLMYYTLTGTNQNRGYPTFLIIFERLEAKTRVHFHRVHPNRYKDGKPTPACRLIEECYRYMAGNIRAEEIYAQQGDLIFIKSEEPKHEPTELVKIKDFESHEFIGMKYPGHPQIENNYPVLLLENKSKSIKNRLGYLYCFTGINVIHPEHDNLLMDAGWYEVRRCKSWEANPRAVWSITID